MLHTIKIPENDLKKLIAKSFNYCEPEDISFGIEEGQFEEK